MPIYSLHAEPVRKEWMDGATPGYTYKEIIGSRTPFRRHCRMMMRRILKFQKSEEGVRRLGCIEWICVVCEKREKAGADLL